MSRLIAVVCQDCDGIGDHEGVVCGWCQGQGHEYVDRAADGGVPPGRREWFPPLLPETPVNPLVPLYQRCVP